MKKYTSVFALFARSSIYKILAILILMTAAECYWFSRNMSELILVMSVEPASGLRFEELISRSIFSTVFTVSFLLVCAVLCIRGSDFGAQESYTLRRLQISEKAVFAIQSIYSSLCFVLLVVWQVAVVLVLAAWYGREVSDIYWNNQTLFLAFCRSDFLASLLPLSNVVRWVRNFFCVAALGISCAKFCWSRRRGSLSFEILFMGAGTAFFFAFDMYSYFMDTALITLGVIISSYACDIVFKNGGKENED